MTILFIFILSLWSCNDFDEINTDNNRPSDVTADVLLPNATRNAVNTSVDAAFLIGNNAAQLTAKALRTEVDDYNWNAFPTYWEGWYNSLTDVKSIGKIAEKNNNQVLLGVTKVLRTWIFSQLTAAYGDIPYFEAISGDEGNFTPAYTPQAEIYEDFIVQLEEAKQLLGSGQGAISGDLLLNGSIDHWIRFANSLQLRILMTASDRLADAKNRFANIVSEGNILSGNDDNVALTYSGIFPNEYPLIPLKIGDIEAVVLSKTSVNVMQNHRDPRLLRYGRPDNEMFNEDGMITGKDNGNGDSCAKGGSLLGVQYYNYPNRIQAAELGITLAEGMIMSYAEVEFLLAEASEKAWISGDTEQHYRNGVKASLEYHLVNYESRGWNDFMDFYENSGVEYSGLNDIREQKWLALFFHGLTPYFEIRRWYVEDGYSFENMDFISAACENLNNDQLPLRFLYPGQEQSLNEKNYLNAVEALGGDDSQNAMMWLVK